MDSDSVSRIEKAIQALRVRSETVNKMLDNEKRIYEAKKREEVAELKRNMVSSLHFLPAEMTEQPEKRKKEVKVIKGVKVINYKPGSMVNVFTGQRLVESKEIRFQDGGSTATSISSLSSVCFSQLSSSSSINTESIPTALSIHEKDNSSQLAPTNAFRMTFYVSLTKLKPFEKVTLYRSYTVREKNEWEERPVKIEATKLANKSVDMLLILQNEFGKPISNITMILDEHGNQSNVRMNNQPMKRA